MIRSRPERIKGKMVVPRYYWMALLMKKGKTYEGIAFLTEHRNYGKGEHIDGLTLSIRELEQFTGLDFFYHLPDDIEQAVETTDPQFCSFETLVVETISSTLLNWYEKAPTSIRKPGT